MISWSDDSMKRRRNEILMRTDDDDEDENVFLRFVSFQTVDFLITLEKPLVSAWT